MKTYRCMNCKKTVEITGKRIRCPFCGFRIITRIAAVSPRRVRAR
ncbi:MAG: DNA-directed RNA polymerase subunit P [Candidatus Aenigmatarchaeota archaeon]